MKKILTELEVIAKRNQKMNQKRLVLDRKYAKMLGLRKEKLEYKKAREIEKFETKSKKSMDRELHNLTHKRQRKEPEDKTVGKRKAKALAEAQLYSKLSRAFFIGKELVIRLADKQTVVNLLDKEGNIRSDIQGWHCYPQKNYSQLAFDIKNIRPITKWTNWRQADTIGERKKNLPLETQIYLEEKSQEPKPLRDGIWYREQYEKYKTLNDNILSAYWLHRWKQKKN